ncbi:hypothetical protein OB955_17100 [Halobacteria archaeon AArc-m2/3/4]|uniref:DUF7344 domain-containing protein n=1 Tax=Natronoglomus mannanivorans TaxID=2979990 RepID=A0AAP2Z2K4_9EURY|nr:hypothetical protein [Halobacteria archaeon AArc-xg1-1]MCU4974443.1 hypothetical protein [Halobacteria archaeon AArc-m2/3/4]
METTEQRTLDLDTVQSLLGQSQRRYLLYHLMENDCGNVEELSLQIAAWEHDESVETVDEDAREQVVISLVHNHLPRLADYDVVEYDLRSGDIVLTDRFDELEPFVDQYKQAENTEVPDVRPLSQRS